ncbi:MAG: hypothetical protein N2557_06100 [Hydrogenophilus sp.]|nr:hypothetical protein [Hydrogenophilus sp.]
MTLHIFTAAALNYWSKVRVLIESIRQHHPHAQIHLALADEWPAEQPHPPELATITPISALPLPNPRAWAFGHTLVELATAIKPFLLEILLARGDGIVVYLDPDILLYHPLDDLLFPLHRGQASILLTPHLTHPETDQTAILDNELAALKHGTYNLGFLAVAPTPTGCSFARWWRERCTRWCLDDIPNGLFTDQRWIDLVPALFPHVHIERAPGANVAPWNLNHRRITIAPMESGSSAGDGRYLVTSTDGCTTPLYFYHHTGWNSGAHHTMAARYGHASPALSQLLRRYEERCRALDLPHLAQRPWAYGFYDDGLPIPLRDRRIYRTRPDLQQRFPDPYCTVPFTRSYRHWLLTQGLEEYPDSPPSLLAHSPSRWRKLRESLRNPRLFLSLLRRYLR